MAAGRDPRGRVPPGRKGHQLCGDRTPAEEPPGRQVLRGVWKRETSTSLWGGGADVAGGWESQLHSGAGGVRESSPAAHPRARAVRSTPPDSDPLNHGSRFAREPRRPATAGGGSRTFRVTRGVPRSRGDGMRCAPGSRLPPGAPGGFRHGPLLIGWRPRWGGAPGAPRRRVRTRGRHDGCPGPPPRPRSAEPIHLGLDTDAYRRAH